MYSACGSSHVETKLILSNNIINCSCIFKLLYRKPRSHTLAQLPVACTVNRTASDGKLGEALET